MTGSASLLQQALPLCPALSCLPPAHLPLRRLNPGCCCRRQVRERKSEQQASTPEGSASQLASRLCAFLKGHAGRRCSSQQLVAHFKPDGINPTLFKEVLKQVATKDDGAWVLKEDFENGS